ncbi:IQ domain-containing protein N [Ascaphus truei]|uniref:IQ domain-containing protein N n=1 Tax=Ascaphus truei TaxID=8439 RepID=UPI003F596C9E
MGGYFVQPEMPIVDTSSFRHTPSCRRSTLSSKRMQMAHPGKSKQMMQSSYQTVHHHHHGRCGNDESQCATYYEAQFQEEENTIMNEAATTIQANWRGYCARRELCEKYNAAITIQANWKGFNTRKNLDRQNESATVIQANYKGYKTRKDMKEMQQWGNCGWHSTSITYESSYGGHESFMQKLVQANAATVIQANYRGYRTRQALHDEKVKPSRGHPTGMHEATFGYAQSKSIPLHSASYKCTSRETSPHGSMNYVTCKSSQPCAPGHKCSQMSFSAQFRRQCGAKDNNVYASTISHRAQNAQSARGSSPSQHIRSKRGQNYVLEGIGVGPIQSMNETIGSSADASEYSSVRRRTKMGDTYTQEKIHRERSPAMKFGASKNMERAPSTYTSPKTGRKVIRYSNNLEQSPERAREKVKAMCNNREDELKHLPSKVHKKPTAHSRHASYQEMMASKRRSAQLIQDRRDSEVASRTLTVKCQGETSECRHELRGTFNYSRKHSPKRTKDMDHISSPSPPEPNPVYTCPKPVSRVEKHEVSKAETSWKSDQSHVIRSPQTPLVWVQAGETRVFKTRKHYQLVIKAATLIQAYYKGFKARQALKHQQQAAIKIQARFRGYKAREYLSEAGVLDLDDREEDVGVNRHNVSDASGDAFGSNKRNVLKLTLRQSQKQCTSASICTRQVRSSYAWGRAEEREEKW